jgi:hypothetical protein
LLKDLLFEVSRFGTISLALCVMSRKKAIGIDALNELALLRENAFFGGSRVH